MRPKALSGSIAKYSRGLALSVLTLIGAPAVSQAVDYYWNTGAATWSVSTWSDNATTGGTTGVLPGVNDTITFNQSSVNGNETVSLGAAQSVLGITFSNTGTTLLQGDAVANRILTIGTSGITINSGAGAVTIGSVTANRNVPVTLGGTQSWANNSATTFTVVNAVTGGANTLTLNGTGAGLTQLTGGLTFSGAGGLIIGKSGTLGTTISGGTITLGGTGGIVINSGASAVGLGANTVSANQSWTNNSATTFTVSGATAAGATTLTLNGAGDGLTTLTGGLTFSGAGGLIIGKAGALGTTISGGALALGGTGGIVINSGASAVSLGANTVSASQSWTNNSATTFTVSGSTGVSTATTLTLNGTGAGLTTLTGGLTTTGTAGLIIGKSGALGTTISGGTITLGGTGGIVINSGASAVSLGANTVSASQSWTNNSATTFTASGLTGVSTGVTLTLGGTGDGLTTLTGGLTTTGTGGLVIGKSGALGTTISGGTITLSGSGGLTINSGASAVTLAAATLAGNQTWTNNSSSLFTVSGNITNSTFGLTIAGSGNTTASGVLGLGSGSGGLTKNGTGILTLTAANLYTGTTTINGGTVTLNRNTGSLNGNALTFGGTGTFNMDNTGAGAALAQSLGTLTFSAGDGTVKITRTEGQDQTITFSSLAARGVGATGNFVNTDGTNSATNGIILTGVTAGAPMGPGYFFNGGTATANYAFNDSTGFVRGINWGTAEGTTATGGAIATATYAQSTGSTTATIATGQVFTGLNFQNTTSTAQAVNLAALATITTDGILRSGNGASTTTISGGTSIKTTTAGADLVIRTDMANDALTISTPILVNGTSGLIKSGVGTLVLGGTNTYNGATYVNGGTLTISSNANLGIENTGSGSVTVASANTSLFTVTITPSAPTGLTIGSGLLRNDGTSLNAVVTNISGTTVTLGAKSAETISSNSSRNFTYVGNSLFLNGATLRTTATFGLFNGTYGKNNRPIAISNGATFNTDAGTTLTVGGGISGTGGLTKSGTGQMSIFGGATNSFTGGVTVTGGTLHLRFSGNSTTDMISASNAVTLNSAVLTVQPYGGNSNSQTFNGVTLASGDNSITTTQGVSQLNWGTELTLGTIIRNPGTTLGAEISFGDANNKISNIAVSNTNTNGILGPWATVRTGANNANTRYARVINTSTTNNRNTILSQNSSTGTVYSNAGLGYTGGADGTAATDANDFVSGTVNYGFTTTVPTTLSGNRTAYTARYSGVGGTINLGSGSNTLTLGGLLNAGTGTLTIDGTGGSGTVVVEATTNELIVNAANAAVAISAPITNNGLTAGTLTKTGSNRLTLSGANTYTGGTYLNAGVLALGSTTTNTTALGTGPLTINGGSLDSTVANLVNTNNNVQTWNGNFTFVGSNSLNLGTGAVTLTGGDRTVAVTANTLTVDGIIGDGGSGFGLTKSGLGTLALNGVNTYTGATNVTGGILKIGTGASTHASSAVSVSGGALADTGTVGGAVTLSSTGGIDLRDGTVTGATPLTLSSTLAITGAAGANNLYFDLGNNTGTSDQISVAGTTTVTTTGSAVVNVNQLGGLAGRNATTYTLIGGAGTLDATNFGKFTLATTKAFGQTYALANGGTNGDLQVVATNASSAPATAFWWGAGGNNWSTVTSWKDALTGAVLTAAPGYNTDVTFSATSATNTTSNLVDVDFDINSLNFNAAAGGVIIGGTKMLTIEAAAGNGINSANTSSTNTINAKVGVAANQTWTVARGGTLAVTSLVTDFSGSGGRIVTLAGGGALTLTNTSGTLSSFGLTVGDGTTFSGNAVGAIASANSQNALGNGLMTVNYGGRLSTTVAFNPTNAFTVNNGGTLNLQGPATGTLTPSGLITLNSGATLQSTTGALTLTQGANVSFPTAGALLFSLAQTTNQPASTVSNAYPSFTGTLAFGGSGGAVTTLTTGAATSFTGDKTIAFNQTGGGGMVFNGLSFTGTLTVAGSGQKSLVGAIPLNSSGSNLGSIVGGGNIVVAMSPLGIVRATGGTNWNNTTINSGTFDLTTSGTIGTGAVTVNGGALRFTAGSGNAIVVGTNGGALETITDQNVGPASYTGSVSRVTAGAPLVLRAGGDRFYSGIADWQTANFSGFKGDIVLGVGGGVGKPILLGAAGLPAVGYNLIVPSGIGFGGAVVTSGNMSQIVTTTDSIYFMTANGAVNLSATGTNPLNRDVWVNPGDFNLTAYTPYGNDYRFVPGRALQSPVGVSLNTTVLTGARNLIVSAQAVVTDSNSSLNSGFETNPGIPDPNAARKLTRINVQAQQTYTGTTLITGVTRSSLQGGTVYTASLWLDNNGTTSQGDLSGTTGITIDKTALLTLAGTVANFGRISAANVPITVKGGGSLIIGDNVTAANNNGVTNRISATSDVTLGGGTSATYSGGGTLTVAFPAAAATHAQTLDGLTIDKGFSTINTALSGGTANLTFTGDASYARNAGGLLTLTAATNFNPRFTTLPTTGVAVGAAGDRILIGGFVGADFLKVANNAGVVNVWTVPAYAANTNLSTWTDDNILINAAPSGSVGSGGSDVTINSLKYTFNSAGTNIAITSGRTLNIRSGMVLSTTSSFNFSGTGSFLTSSSGELIFNTGNAPANQNYNLDPQIKQNSGNDLTLTFNGGGNQALNLNSANNAIKDIYLYGAGNRLTSISDRSFGPDNARTIFFDGGILTFNNNQAYNNTSLVVGRSGGTWSDSGTTITTSFGGSVTLNGAFSIGNAGGVKTLSGQITGPGYVTVTSGRLILSGSNTGWTGGVQIQSGSQLRLENANAAGTGPIVNDATSGGGGLGILEFGTGFGSTSLANRLVGTSTTGFLISNAKTATAVTLTGNLTTIGGLTFQGYDSGSAVSETVLSGSVATSGTPITSNYAPTSGTATAFQQFINGQSGITLGVTAYKDTTTAQLAYGTSGFLAYNAGTTTGVTNGAEGYVRFAPDANGNLNSFLPGAVGPGYVAALRKGGASTLNFGYLLTGSGSGTTYQLPEGKSFVIGTLGSGTGQTGTFGATGTGTNTATFLGNPKAAPGQLLAGFKGGDINIHANAATDTATFNLSARNATDTLVLGDGVTAANNVVITPTWGDSGATSAMTLLQKRTGLTTLKKTGAGTLEIKGVNLTHTDGTNASGAFTWDVNVGTLKLNGTGVNTTILTDGNTATTSDITITGGTLELAASEQIANTGSINMTSGAFNFGTATGKTQTIDKFTNSGGTFTTGANTLIGLGNTVTWSGTSTNTVNNGGSVQDLHIVISGGTNTVEGGATGGVLQLNASGTGLEMSAGATLTLNSDALFAGKLLLSGNISTIGDATVTIASAGVGNPGNIDLNNGTRTFTVADGAATTDMSISAKITNTGSIIKDGTGTLSLGAANDYVGTTTINNGTLIANALGALPLSSRTAVSFGGGGGTLTLGSSFGQSAASLTSAGAATVALGSNTLTVGAGSGNTDFKGSIGGAGNLIKDDASTQVLSGTNAYTGTTTVSGGTLEVQGSLSGTTAVTVNTSGTLLLNSAASPIINTAATMTVGGGTVKIDNSLSNTNQTFGSLTLTGTSILDFGTGSNGNTMTFSSLSFSTTKLNVYNWSGSAYGAGVADIGSLGDTQDRLLFTGTTSIGTSGDNRIEFFSDGGTTSLGFGQEVAFGSQFELVPITAVPEPATTALIGSIALCALIGYRERRRFTGFGKRTAARK